MRSPWSRRAGDRLKGVTRAGWRLLKRWGVRCIFAAGSLFLLFVGLAFTRVPFDAHRALGLAAGECAQAPGVIVVLGGSGMPSGAELLRLDHAAGLAATWPEAALLIVHPGDTAVIGRMRQELLVKGVAPGRITLLNEGDNTRAQAMAVASLMGAQGPSIAVVTAPENMYRTVRTFRRAGFGDRVCGAPAWDHAMYHDFDYDHRRIGGKPWTPDLSGDTGVRYTFWNYLKLEVTCLREYAAIAYYWMNDWI